MQNMIKELISNFGDNPNREGMKRTPERYLKAMKYLTSGYDKDPKEVLNNAIFEETYDEMVIVKDIEFYSLCEHHLLPFFGKCHIGYIPKGKIVGLSKLPRLVEIYSRRFQVQERLTSQIANAIQELIAPRGVAVLMEAYHLCMMMRGVEKQNSKAITSTMLGGYRKMESRNEFLSIIHHQSIK